MRQNLRWLVALVRRYRAALEDAEESLIGGKSHQLTKRRELAFRLREALNEEVPP